MALAWQLNCSIIGLCTCSLHIADEGSAGLASSCRLLPSASCADTATAYMQDLSNIRVAAKYLQVIMMVCMHCCCPKLLMETVQAEWHGFSRNSDTIKAVRLRLSMPTPCRTRSSSLTWCHLWMSWPSRSAWSLILCMRLQSWTRSQILSRCTCQSACHDCAGLAAWLLHAQRCLLQECGAVCQATIFADGIHKQSLH